MENGINIRLELGIDARRFIQQVQLSNDLLEELKKRSLRGLISKLRIRKLSF